MASNSTATASRATCLGEQENLPQTRSTRLKYFCGHCNGNLTKTRYFKHKKLYYDTRAKSWKRERVYQQYDGSLCEFSMPTVSDEESSDNTNEMECKYNNYNFI